MAVKSDKPELNLDEDLFDFPVMEMTVEGVREVKPEEIAAAVAAATAKPAAASATPAPAAPAATTTTAEEVAAVAKAAALVDHLERVAPELLEPTVARSTSAPAAATRRDPRVLALVGLVLGVNLCLGLLVWRATDSVGAGVETMREELARNAERIAQQNERIADLARQRAAAGSTTTHSTQSSNLDTAAPALEAFEDTALRLAQRELELGRHNEARVRLNRLLARIDAVDAARRADVEAQASFMIARSLQTQADLKRSKGQ